MTIGGRPAVVDPTNASRSTAVVTSGTSIATVVARDFSGNQASRHFQVSQSATGKTFTFDANGKLTSDGLRTLEWDSLNRVVSTVITHEFAHVDFVKVQVYNAMLKEESIPYSSKAACDAALPSAYQRVQRAFRRALQDTQRMHQ